MIAQGSEDFQRSLNHCMPRSLDQIQSSGLFCVAEPRCSTIEHQQKKHAWNYIRSIREKLFNKNSTIYYYHCFFFFFKLLLLYTIIYNFKDIVCCCFTLSLSDLNISLQTRPARVDGVGRSCVDGVPSGPRTCLSLPDAFAYLRSPMGESPLDANELWERPLSQPGGVRVGRVEAG